jgi:tRNA modification GTPase
MLTDPIVALATAPGRAALAVVRVSGSGAFAIAGRVIQGFRTSPARRATLATFRAADGSPIDRGLFTVFPGPESYTGEDLVELSCHGGLLVPARLVAALEAAGARPAHPGEFTRRAVLNGKLDLVQAEAVGDLVDATAPAQARAALRQLEGGLSRRIGELRDGLIDVQSLLGYEIDFPEEDDGPVPAERVRDALEAVACKVDRLLATSADGERLREGALVVFAGRPNTGKSSLFNALLGTSRALVTEVPGTTRDAVEAPTALGGWPVRLVDTAGIRDADDRVERLGIEVSRRYLAAADLVLLCAEAGRTLDAAEQEIATERPSLVVRTKADLMAGCAGGEELVVSVVTGGGLDRLRDAVARRVFGDRIALGDLEPALASDRQRTALARARDALAGARPQLEPGGDAVLAAHHVQEAIGALDQLIGAIDVEEVLGRIFARFCVGK